MCQCQRGDYTCSREGAAAHCSTLRTCVDVTTLQPELFTVSGMLHLVGLSTPACSAGMAEPEPKLGLAATSDLCFLAGDPVVSVSLESGCCSATSGHPAEAQAAMKANHELGLQAAVLSARLYSPLLLSLSETNCCGAGSQEVESGGLICRQLCCHCVLRVQLLVTHQWQPCCGFRLHQQGGSAWARLV